MQVFGFVRIHFNLCLGKPFMTQKNCDKVLSVVEQMIQLDQAPARKWQSLIGTLQAQAYLILLGRLKVRPIQFHLTIRWKQNRNSPNTSVPLTNSVKTLLQWWQNLENLKQGIPLELPPFTHHLIFWNITYYIVFFHILSTFSDTGKWFKVDSKPKVKFSYV